MILFFYFYFFVQLTRHFVLDSHVHEIFWCWQRKKRKSSLRHTKNLSRKNSENNSSSNKRRKKVSNLNKIFISIFLSFFLFCFLFLLLFSLFLFFLHDFSYCSYSLLTIFIFPIFSPYFLPIKFCYSSLLHWLSSFAISIFL